MGFARPGGARGRPALRTVAATLIALAAAAGWFGLREFYTRSGGEVSVLTLVDGEVRLFTANWDGGAEESNGLPVVLLLAKVFAPVATASLGLFVGLDAVGWRRRRRRNHVIVVGDTIEAHAVADRLESAIPGLADQRLKVVRVDRGDRRTLESAGIARARDLYACADDEADFAANLTAVDTALALSRHPQFKAHARVSDLDLWHLLRARYLMRGSTDKPIDVFNADELAARHHMRSFDFGAHRSPHLLVSGASSFGQAIIGNFAREWVARGQPHVKVPITLVDPQAERRARQIVERWPLVGKACELIPISGGYRDMLAKMSVPPYRSYFCDNDEEVAYKKAFLAAARWPSGPKTVVLRLNRLAQRVAAVSAQAGGVFDDFGGTLDLVSVSLSAAEELARREDAAVAFARAFHQTYVEDCRRRGMTVGTNPYMADWDDLPAELKAANLAQAMDFPGKLRLIGCTIAPRSSIVAPFFFREGEVDRLACAEHERWVQGRIAAGWRYAADRDDAGKQHPLLVAWDQLSSYERDRNRDIIREVPLAFTPVLEAEGLQIVRTFAAGDAGPAQITMDEVLTPAAHERIAQAIHQRFLATEVGRGNAMYTYPALRPWEELTDDLRQANRAQASDIGHKLDLVGAFPTETRPAVEFSLSEAEVEMLAVAEHERWTSERLRMGWTYGDSRENGPKLHPLLVPWHSLPEEVRERDRVFVRAIPELLHEAGLYLVRHRPDGYPAPALPAGLTVRA